MGKDERSILAAVIGSDPGTTTPTDQGICVDIGSEKGGVGSGIITPTTGIETETEPVGMVAGQR